MWLIQVSVVSLVMRATPVELSWFRPLLLILFFYSLECLAYCHALYRPDFYFRSSFNFFFFILSPLSLQGGTADLCREPSTTTDSRFRDDVPSFFLVCFYIYFTFTRTPDVVTAPKSGFWCCNSMLCGWRLSSSKSVFSPQKSVQFFQIPDETFE